MKQLFLSFLLVLGFSSCGPTENPTPIKTPAPQATITNAITPTPSNSAVLTLIAQTPQPSPWATAMPNEIGIVPGITTEAEMRSLLREPDYLGCVLDNKENWTVECKAPGGFRKLFQYPRQNVYVETDQGRVISVAIRLVRRDIRVEAILTVQGIPELVKFIIPPKRTNPIPPNPWGDLVYASKGVRFQFDCQKGPGEPCDGVSRDAPIAWIIYFVPMKIADWFEKEEANPPVYLDKNWQFYIRPWEGFKN